MALRFGSYFFAAASAASGIALALSCAPSAFAVTVDDLSLNYKLAVGAYEATLVEQEKNAQDIIAVESEMEAADVEFAQSAKRLGDSVSAMYKQERNRSELLDTLLGAESLTDAVKLSESYTRIENYWAETMDAIKQKREQLDDKKSELEEKRLQISDRIFETENAVEAAKAALIDASHSDGARFHQVQGNGSNCGATAFIVGVNILLHEDRYTDNVAVWNGPGFEGDSTQSLAFKGATWLMANGLADQLSCTSVDGDIHYVEQMKAELEQGRVVVISSGSGSIWQRADGTEAGTGSFPDGHWIVFYHYADGVFYANDSSVKSSKGAGCAYTTDQMRQWLDGRSNHFATVISKKHFG